MEKHILMLRYSFIFFVFILTSCGARKVSIDKTDTIVKVDSTSSTKKEQVITTENNVVINNDIEECEITPIDTTKPVVIGDKKYFNAKIKIKKTKYSKTDATKKTEQKKEVQQVKVFKNSNKKTYNKESDKKESRLFYWPWILILILLALYFYVRREIKKHLL